MNERKMAFYAIEKKALPLKTHKKPKPTIKLNMNP